MRETRVRFLGWVDALEKEMAIHSSTPAWKIPWKEETGGVAKSRTRLSDFTFTFSFNDYFALHLELCNWIWL